MPRDLKKNRYLNLGIARGSWVLEKLDADAKRHQMEDYLAKLIVLRLTEYYTLMEKGSILPGATALQQAPAIQTTTANGHEMTTSERGAAPSPSTVMALSERADQNADQALSFFKMDDD